MSETELEVAVIRRMLADESLPPVQQGFDGARLERAGCTRSAVGFVSSYSPTVATRLFEASVCLRWGKLMGRINRVVDVDFVVYVDDGYLSGVECVTFGGELFPLEIEVFEWVAREEG